MFYSYKAKNIFQRFFPCRKKLRRGRTATEDKDTTKKTIRFKENAYKIKDDSLSLRGLGIKSILEIKGLKDLTDLKRLDLSENNIVKIEGLENLIKLEELILEDNFIYFINGLDTLVNLKELNLKNNEIVEITGLNNLKKIINLNLDGNNIPDKICRKLEVGIKKCYPLQLNLKPINFIEYSRSIKEVSIKEDELVKENTVEFHGAQLLESEAKVLEELENKYSFNLARISSLESRDNLCFKTVYNRVVELRLREGSYAKSLGSNFISIGSRLEEFPQCITNLPHLKVLDLSRNFIPTIPDSIKKLISLKKLNLRGNGIENLPEWIGNLKSLRFLDLSHNSYSHRVKVGIEKLPESIGKLKNLKILHLEDCALKFLPETIGDMDQLEELYLEVNMLQNLPQSIGNLKLRKLILRRNNLTSLPKTIGNLEFLEEFDLYFNNLVELPESIGNLQKLKKLNLGHNGLKSLPEPIWNLKNLIELNLGGNQLQSLPKLIGNLKSLEKLNLSYNDFEKIPKVVNVLHSLIKLDLSGNKISVIEGLGDLENLNELNLEDNLISQELLEDLGELDYKGYAHYPQEFVEYCHQKKEKEGARRD